jgi:hypothetical protein
VNRSRFLQATLLVFLVAVALRCLPLLSSPYPFNPDGVLYAGDARRTLAAGELPLARLQPDALSFTAWVALVSDVLGVRPLVVAQPTIAVVGAMPVVLAVAVARRLGGRLGLGPARARRGALLAGTLLAVEGLYLHRSMPVEDQTLGLMLVPLVVVTVARGYAGDGRWYAVGVVALVSLPPLHNLDSVVAAAALTLLAAVLLVRDRSAGAAGVAALAAATWGYTLGYMELVAATTPAEILQAERLASVPGLVLAWLVLTSVALVAWQRFSARRRRLAGLAVGTLWFAILLLNAIVPVFPGTPATPPLLFALLAPLGVVLAVASVGGGAVTDRGPDGLAVAALFAAPALFVGLSLTAALTPEYVNTVYRASTFLHFPVVVLAGLGVYCWRPGAASWPSPNGRTVLAVVLVVCAAASIPVAVSGLELLPYKGVTTPAELSASGFAAERTETWAGDDHLVRIQGYHEGDANGSRTATYRWLRGGTVPDCAVLSQRSWTTTGAQFYPAPPERLGATAYERTLAQRSVVYATTGPDPIVLSVPADGTTTC